MGTLGAIRCAWQEADELPRYRSLEAFLSSDTHEFGKTKGQKKADPNPNSLDIGCGYNPRNPFNASKLYGVDIRGHSAADSLIKNYRLVYWTYPLPGSFFIHYSFDLLEHVPRALVCDDQVRFVLWN